MVQRISQPQVQVEPCWKPIHDSFILSSDNNRISQEEGSQVWEISVKSTRFLCSEIPENRSWVGDNKLEILKLLLKVFEDSRGSLR